MSARLFRYLSRHYGERGYEVYSRHLSHLQIGPADWKGPFPDMLVEKGEERVAIFSETSEDLSDSSTAEAWRRAIEGNAANVKIFVRRKSDLSLAKRVLKQENLVAELALLRKETFKPFGLRFSKRRAVQTTVVLLLALLFSVALVWFVTELYEYSVEFYEPRDREREAGQEGNVK